MATSRNLTKAYTNFSTHCFLREEQQVIINRLYRGLTVATADRDRNPWRFTQERDASSMLVMLDFLNEIRATGTITRPRSGPSVSYRHAWNLIGSGRSSSVRHWSSVTRDAVRC